MNEHFYKLIEIFIIFLPFRLGLHMYIISRHTYGDLQAYQEYCQLENFPSYLIRKILSKKNNMNGLYALWYKQLKQKKYH